MLLVLCLLNLLEVGSQEGLQNFIYFWLVAVVARVSCNQISFLEEIDDFVHEVFGDGLFELLGVSGASPSRWAYRRCYLSQFLRIQWLSLIVSQFTDWEADIGARRTPFHGA